MRFGAKTFVVAVLCVNSTSFAQTHSHSSGDHKADMIEGVVEMVDTKARNITLRHAEIRNVQMPAMTMVFGVKDAALLDKVKAGDKVKFKVEAIGGAPTVTVIEVAK
jgi:Cu(I)/Ag(I) efflux system periplasmic protein CusF